MKLVRTSLRDQARLSQSTLGCLSPGPSERTRRGTRHSSGSQRWLEFFMSKNLTEMLKNATSKHTNGRGTISASVQQKKPVAICTNERDLFFRLDQGRKLGIGFAKYESG